MVLAKHKEATSPQEINQNFTLESLTSVANVIFSDAISKFAEGSDGENDMADLTEYYVNMLMASAMISEGEAMVLMEFEIENEQRIYVNVTEDEDQEWENYVVDVYDKSRRSRVRLKNGVPRLSLKNTILPQKGELHLKKCVRIELKANSDEAKNLFFAFLLHNIFEPGSKVSKKVGRRIDLKNGEQVWLNRNERGQYWIEVDTEKDIIPHLPDNVEYVSHSKSGTGLYGIDLYDQRSFVGNTLVNYANTSRSANGVIDTSVHEAKVSEIEGTEDEIKSKVNDHLEEAIKYVWFHKDAQIDSVDDLRMLCEEIICMVNAESSNPLALRTHPVPYGRRIEPEDLPETMDQFYQDFYKKLKEVDAANLDPIQLGVWLEFEFDANIHPLKDGCGRVTKALSAFIFARFNHVLPEYKSRDEYYQAMNSGYQPFEDYYVESIHRGAVRLLSWNEQS